MVQTIEITNTILSWLTLAGGVFVVLSVLSVLATHFNQDLQKTINPLQKVIAKNATTFSFIVALTAMLGSLTYSDVIGYEPCKLCWYQRIFMYPQVFLLGLASLKKDKNIVNYAILLSSVGAMIAVYHYLMQISFADISSCGVVGYSTACSQRFVLQFGYITIPIMSLTAFALILTFLIIAKRANKK